VGYHLPALRACCDDFECWVGLVQTVGTRGASNQMAYCDCGSPATVVEAAGTSIARTAPHEYDFQGKRWKTTTPEGSMSTNPNLYGGLISSSGTLAGANTMRFSNKLGILSATGACGGYYYG